MRPRVPDFITIPFIIIVITFVFYVFSGGNVSYIWHPVSLSVLIISLILLLILEVLNKFIYNQKLKFLSQKERSKLVEQNRKNYFVRLYRSGFLDAKEEEKDVAVIDHGFDEILELDNRLPSWWVNLFYLTIMFAVIYFLAYTFTDFAHPEKEYELDYDKQLAEIQAYEKTRPQMTLETARFDENLVEEGKVIFKESCATCHEADGRGNIGPNLTDGYWINKQEKSLFKNVFHMAWYGSENNPTMRAFGASGEIKGNDIQKIASYVYSINRNPKKPSDGKAPEGEKVTWEEEQ
ncbi:cbb3-type cytochrome c oxidase N-terminal domain-containing protein [Bacteroidetes bacterium endosymbiont of Geopemphigus sp.]|uniref:cbb3-type cytochrome c oxidase N-terminal domain-containing protein n=1 Tax=Bacteroidetes bacterium endosymbiont of Geopemphigus sp. TaxID=2047937 RepID=UPI000CD13A93|nr:cbb3-type cytochrome c oxidase N-terminal domain-containing protein [Bacteroidetes bacterium endosymbiont of Geopemphigus sp.]